MGQGTYCGANAGILKDHHPECRQRNLDGWSKMVGLATEAVVKNQNIDDLPATLLDVARSSYIPESGTRRAMVEGWGHALDHFLDDSLLSESEEERLLAFANRNGLSQEELNLNGAFDRALKAKVLTDIVEGRVPIYSPIQRLSASPTTQMASAYRERRQVHDRRFSSREMAGLPVTLSRI